MTAIDTARDLGTFEGHKVTAAGIEIRNAAGGLQDALKVEPVAWADDEEVTVLMRCKVKALRFDKIRDGEEDTGLRRRVHIMNATTATVVDNDFGAELLAAQAERIAAANRGPLDDELARKELQAAHEEGAHDDELGSITLANGDVIQCPDCEWES